MELGSAGKKRRISSLTEASEDDDERDDDGEEPCQAEYLSFRLLHLPSVWKGPGTTTKRISVAILLPSGIGPGDFTVRVLDGGLVLEVSVLPMPALA